MVNCPNCGNRNDSDAKYCEKCGANLKRYPGISKTYHGSLVKEGMATSTKVLIIACIVLVAGLGLAIGLLWQTNSGTPVSVSQTGEQVTYKASWHEVTSFTGTYNDYRSFQTKGKRFKVVMSATPILNYDTNSMTVDIFSNNDILSSGSLDWGATDALTTKEKTIQLTGPPGTYWINIYALELESWTVKVYDYY